MRAARVAGPLPSVPRTSAKPASVLIIGSGPVVIGQAAEFDYAGRPIVASAASAAAVRSACVAPSTMNDGA